jgi:hypothetical protein
MWARQLLLSDMKMKLTAAIRTRASFDVLLLVVRRRALHRHRLSPPVESSVVSEAGLVVDLEAVRLEGVGAEP